MKVIKCIVCSRQCNQLFVLIVQTTTVNVFWLSFRVITLAALSLSLFFYSTSYITEEHAGLLEKTQATFHKCDVEIVISFDFQYSYKQFVVLCIDI